MLGAEPMSDPVRLLWPVPENSVITQTFDQHVQRAKENGWCSAPGNCPGGIYYYGGIDWGIPTGTLIIAPMSGRVEVQNQGAKGYGLNLRITGADGYYIILAHLQVIRQFTTGDDVQAGDVCALSNNTGNSSGPHLHFELRHNGVPVDPMPYLTGAIVTPPPVEPPAPLGSLVKIATPYTAVGLRTKPVEDGSVLLRRLASKDGYVFERLDEVFQGRQWTRVACYIATEFLESVK
jgi:hypothetical protein